MQRSAAQGGSDFRFCGPPRSRERARRHQGQCRRVRRATISHAGREDQPIRVVWRDAVLQQINRIGVTAQPAGAARHAGQRFRNDAGRVPAQQVRSPVRLRRQLRDPRFGLHAAGIGPARSLRREGNLDENGEIQEDRGFPLGDSVQRDDIRRNVRTWKTATTSWATVRCRRMHPKGASAVRN